MLLLPSPILLLLLLLSTIHSSPIPQLNSSFPHLLHPDSVVSDLNRKVELSVQRFHRNSLLSSSSMSTSCMTGNPVDDCWRCDRNWAANRHRLADCAIGFGRDVLGGKGGRIYVVTDNSDHDPANPSPGTLRYGVIQEEPLWIIFSASTTIHLTQELIVNSFKTIDGRGADVHIVGAGCITLQYVSNVIIHNVHVHHCIPGGNAKVRSSPTHVGYRGRSDGDGISIYSSRKIWIDHCSLSYCTDGLIDAIMGSTAITISNNYFSHHDEVMLMGHTDDYLPDSGMQVTLAFNKFGEALVQRMPRCRRGYFHVVNNDFTGWEMYAIGGSANPTINSQGNRYRAPDNVNAKEVTKRILSSPATSGDEVWRDWNWRTEGDVMFNGAFFVPSGAGALAAAGEYWKASSMEPLSAQAIELLTLNAGVLGTGGHPNRNSGNSYQYDGNLGGSGIKNISEAYGGYVGLTYTGGGIVNGASSDKLPRSFQITLFVSTSTWLITQAFVSFPLFTSSTL